MPTLPNMGLITPTLGGDSGTWDDKINAAFGLVDAHDHTSGKGVLVPVSGLNINADFVMAGNAVTQLGSLAFNAVTALAAGARRLFVSSADNELYWRTNGGTNVKLTNGTSINTTLVGGIVGDYSSVGAELSYVDADEVYTFEQEDGTWARIAASSIRIYEHASNASSYVELSSPAALAASYTVTFPAALPGSTSILQITSAGVLTASNTLPTLTGGLTLDTNTNLTLQGTGVLKHGTRQWFEAFGDAQFYTTAAGTKTNNLSGGNDYGWSLPAGTHVFLLRTLKVGNRITTVYVLGTGQLAGGAANVTYDLRSQNAQVPGGASASMLSGTVSSDLTTVTLTPTGSGFNMTNDDMILLTIVVPAGCTYGYYGVLIVADNP